MRHTLCVALGLLTFGSGARAFAQDNTTGRCATPDSVSVTGNSRVPETDVRASAGLVAGVPLNARSLQEAIKNLFATGQFEDVQITCNIHGTDPHQTYTLLISVKERLVLSGVNVTGAKRVSSKTLHELIDLTAGKPLEPGNVTRAVTRIDSTYQAAGYFLAKIVPETTTVAGKSSIVFHINEGRRLAVSGIRIHGNEALSDREIVRAMKTKPEGFLWFRNGEFDDDKFAADLAERLPECTPGSATSISRCSRTRSSSIARKLYGDFFIVSNRCRFF